MANITFSAFILPFGGYTSPILIWGFDNKNKKTSHSLILLYIKYIHHLRNFP